MSNEQTEFVAPAFLFSKEKTTPFRMRRQLKFGGNRTGGGYDDYCSTLKGALAKAEEGDTFVLSAGQHMCVHFDGAFLVDKPGVTIVAEQVHQATLLDQVVINAPDVKLFGLVFEITDVSAIYV